jgi:c-di-GMP-related signal transduction protein
MSLPPDSTQNIRHTANLSVTRQAVLDESKSVFGYELFDRAKGSESRDASSDAQMMFNLLSINESQPVAGEKNIFLHCNHESLAAGHLDLISPKRVILQIQPLPISQIDQIQNRVPVLEEIKRRGFRMAFEYSILTRSYAAWLPLASFIKFDLSVLKPEAISSFVKLAQAKSSAQLIAEKVETLAHYELVSQLGVKLFQGYWFAMPTIVKGRTLRPAQANILQLISLVRKQASTNEIEEILKRDPTLSFNLLRFINSAGFGARTEVTTFKHAVLMLGLNRLFKWAALLMITSRSGDTPPAVGSLAVVRGRLMELLAADILPPEDSDNAFVAGVFSLLDTMLGMPMSEALGSVSLPSEVSDALLLRSGKFAPLLELALACETGDDKAFAAAAGALGLDSNQINWAHLQALTWAESFSP